MNLLKMNATILISLFATTVFSATGTLLDAALTKTILLKNGMPLIARETPGSDIVHVEVSFLNGSSNQPSNQKAANLLAFETMPYATKAYPKEKIFALSEKYSFGVECRGGVEVSHCQIETIQEYLPQALNILASVVLEPTFNDADVTLAKQQRIADFQQEIQNPEAHANSVANTIFYDQNHPYRLLPEEGVKQTETLTPADLKKYHSSVLNAGKMFIVYVGPKMSATTSNFINKKFGTVRSLGNDKTTVPPPVFDAKNAVAFDHRTIPTAYIRIKFNAPSTASADAPAASVMFEILSEMLHEEVRTKRSLSYSVYANTIQYKQGIGIIGASTSKPQETIEAITIVIKKLRDHGVSQEELNEYRNSFSTSYFLTMETHGQLAAALSSSQAYFGDAAQLYQIPNKINAVTPSDIQRVAKEVLKNFRVGVVFDKEKFNPKWITPIKSL